MAKDVGRPGKQRHYRTFVGSDSHENLQVYLENGMNRCPSGSTQRDAQRLLHGYGRKRQDNENIDLSRPAALKFYTLQQETKVNASLPEIGVLVGADNDFMDKILYSE
ncbi:hypothetical protein O0544_04525 [Edwardsiella anguillarum]|nr:hypothetical protein [Edwardsiella anguillarum]